MSEEVQEVVAEEALAGTEIDAVAAVAHDSHSKKEKKDKKDKKDKKAEKKRLKALETSLETNLPSPKDRYRVLFDLVRMNNDISEMADKKTRFALVILGAVNAVNLFVVARPEIVMGSKSTPGGWMGVYLTSYIILSLYIFIQSIGALKPRISTLLTKIGASENMTGLRFVSTTIESEFERYYELWRSAPYANINRELALSAKMVAEVIASKYKALHRMYTGLLILVFMTAGLIAVLGFLRILEGF